MIDWNGQKKTPLEIRQKMYENIVDEALFISRASEGAVSAEWIMSQPIFIRKKYAESFAKEKKDRKASMESRQRNK